MTRALVGALVGGVLVAGALGSAPAAAYLCTRSPDGPSLAWPQRTVAVRRANAPRTVDAAEVDRVIGASAASWSNVDCSDFTIVQGAPAADRKSEFDWAEGAQSDENENVIVFRANDPEDDPVDLWLHSFSALAITTVTFVATSGRILDADVEFNTASFDFTACAPGPSCPVQFDLENTLTHELGHVLGLDHPPPGDPGAEDATMFASAPPSDIEKRTLAADDEEGICFLYPQAAATQECYGVTPRPPPPVHFEQAVCGAGGRKAPLAAALLLLGVLRRRGRRRQGS